jgi:hypothetical protein
VGHGRQLQRPRADARLDRTRRDGGGDAVQLGQPDRPALDGPADRDSSSVKASLPSVCERAGCSSFSCPKPPMRSNQYQKKAPIPIA